MLKVFCVYFDRRPVWRSDCVEPIQAGCARTGLDLGMLRDDTGESISAENVRYGEMTAWYWVWKNYLPAHPEVDRVGFCHYRRFLDFAGVAGGRTRRMTYARFRRTFEAHYTASGLERRLAGFDLAMREPADSGHPTLRAQFAHMRPRNLADWDRFERLVRVRHPDRAAVLEAVLNQGRLAMELQFVMTRALFEDFMSWAFGLCRACEAEAPWSGDSEGDGARAPAFLVERFFGVWLALRQAERPVRVLALPLVKLTARPWWFRLARPFARLLGGEREEAFFNRYK